MNHSFTMPTNLPQICLSKYGMMDYVCRDARHRKAMSVCKQISEEMYTVVN